jgi:hypothetical protein
LDRTRRVTMARVDNDESRGRVFAARRHIYEKHISVQGSAIEKLLKSTSQVPTVVSRVPILFSQNMV